MRNTDDSYAHVFLVLDWAARSPEPEALLSPDQKIQWMFGPDGVKKIGAVFWDRKKRGTINIYASSGTVTVTGGTAASRDSLVKDMDAWTFPWGATNVVKQYNPKTPKSEKQKHASTTSMSEIRANAQQCGRTA